MPAHIGSRGSLLLVGNQVWYLLLQIIIYYSLKFRIHRLCHGVAQKSPAPLQKVTALHSLCINRDECEEREESVYTVTSQSACTGSPCGGRCLRLQGQGEGVFYSKGKEASAEMGVGGNLARRLLCDWLRFEFKSCGGISKVDGQFHRTKQHL